MDPAGTVIETVHLSCTTCPSECTLTVTVETGADGNAPRATAVTGNRCPRGRAFAEQEISCPVRVLTTTVAVRGGDERLLPVRTARAIPLETHADAMRVIQDVQVDAPIRMGDIVLADILGTGVDLIASMDVDAAKTQ